MKELTDMIIYCASLLGAVSTVCGFVIYFINKKLGQMIAPMQAQIRKMDVKDSRRFLIDFLCDVEKGVPKDEVQWKFAHDVYDHYVGELKENSYVKDKWERVITNGNNE